MPRLAPHPRLYASRAQLERLAQPFRLPILAEAATHVAGDANEFVLGEKIAFDESQHNALLLRARKMQKRILTLLVRRFRTGHPRYRDAVVRHVEEMDRWTHWSWIALRQGRNHPNDIFDLSYGENSATLAIAFDWLYYALSEGERARFAAMARRRALIPFLKNTEKKKPSWWFGKPDTNWNTVCAGGAGMLALSLYEEAPESREVLRRAEQSVAPFMKYLNGSDGGWPEGIGYWNYGMRYAFMYLLSHERATGRKHPLLKLPAVRQTLEFPLDFCPRGVPCSFGDVNRWTPLPFHWAAAERLGRRDLVPQLDRAWKTARTMTGSWPDEAELLLLHPRAPAKPRASTAHKPAAKLYRGLGWGFLADRWPEPQLYVSIRAGTTEVPHGHMDLLSFVCVAGGETMVANLGVEEYLDTTFGKRRYELFETTPAAKNTILINGVGIAKPSSVKAALVRKGRLAGIRLDASDAMGPSRDASAAEFCARLFLLLSPETLLIVDRIETRFPARFETRLHTYARVKTARDGAVLTGRQAGLQVAYGADVACGLFTAVGAPTTPGKGAAMLRWCSTSRAHRQATLVTALSRTQHPLKASVQSVEMGLLVEVTGGARAQRVRLRRDLTLPKGP